MLSDHVKVVVTKAAREMSSELSVDNSLYPITILAEVETYNKQTYKSAVVPSSFPKQQREPKVRHTQPSLCAT